MDTSKLEEHLKQLIELDKIDPELIKYINSLPIEDAKKYVHKTLVIGEDEELSLQLEKMILMHPLKYRRLYWSMIYGNASHLVRLEFINNRIKYSDIIEIYEQILKEIFILSKELKLSNSLELSNLFTYLLWNGYLSKNKQKEHISKGRKFIHGLHFADIIDGKGVCLNNAEMLKDFLNICGYPSAMLENYCSDNIKIDYLLLYKMMGIDEKLFLQEMKSRIVDNNEILNARISNHVFNLVEENNKLYIYDATSAVIHRIVNPYRSELIVGEGSNKLFPNSSYMTCSVAQEYKLIDKLSQITDYTSTYTKEDFILTSERELETINRNTPLIEDFYREIRPSLISISEATDKVKSRKKKR